MKYETAAAFRDALERRLRNHSREHGFGIDRLRKEVAFDRLLARLQAQAPGLWTLKGGYALQLRLGEQTRTTRDIDVLSSVDFTDLEEALIAAQTITLDDFFGFTIERTRTIDVGEQGAATRYSVEAELDGRTFERFVVDVSRSDPLGWRPEQLLGTGLLQFAGIDRISLPAITVEQQLAEKLEAYTRKYGSRDAPSSRTKDLVDMQLIARRERVSARTLAQAIGTVFRSRGSGTPPRALPLPPRDWARPYAAMVSSLALEPDLESGHDAAAALLDPVLDGTARGVWRPETRNWQGISPEIERLGPHLEPPETHEIAVRGPYNALSSVQPLFVITVEVQLRNTGDEPATLGQIEARSRTHGSFTTRAPKLIAPGGTGLLELTPLAPVVQKLVFGEPIEIDATYLGENGDSHSLRFVIRALDTGGWNVQRSETP